MRKDPNRSRGELSIRHWNGGRWFHTLDIYKQHFIVQWVDSEAHGRHLCKLYGQKKRLGKTPVAYPLEVSAILEHRRSDQQTNMCQQNTTLPRPTPALPAYQSNHGGAPVPAAHSGPVRPRAPSKGVASVVESGEEEEDSMPPRLPGWVTPPIPMGNLPEFFDEQQSDADSDEIEVRRILGRRCPRSSSVSQRVQR